MNKRIFYEFFAGGGMARAGLGDVWHCAFANDFDAAKARSYRENWGASDFVDGDINDLRPAQLPGIADLAWASFPCQDLSLAGNAAGLGTEADQTRSGAFWAFWRLMSALIDERRAPKTIVLENVYGSLTANNGRDFALIARSLALGGYRFGAIVLDAVHFVPQSRPRVFIVAVRNDLYLPAGVVGTLASNWHPLAMRSAIGRLCEVDLEAWFWLNPDRPTNSAATLSDLLLENPSDVEWHGSADTQKLVDMMSAVNRSRLDAMLASGTRKIGTIYKRTRVDGAGNRRQRAELRDDNIAGCLRTPGGGSSRQIVMVTEGGSVRSRLLSGREAARLMGLPDSYILPRRYNDAYHLAGDGVVVPAVRFLANSVIEPILAANVSRTLMAAA